MHMVDETFQAGKKVGNAQGLQHFVTIDHHTC